MIEALQLPSREDKPRTSGLTCIIDSGYPTSYFEDVVRSHHPLIDAVKFGWGTSLVTREIERKIAILRELEVPYLFGGTLLEVACSRNSVDEFTEFVRKHRCPIIEVSDGTINLSSDEKCDLIRRFADEFTVWSEVGYKDQQRSLDLPPS